MHRFSTTLIVIAAIGFAGANLQAQSASTAAGFDVMEKTITELQEAMAAGTVTSRKLVEIYLARIAAYDKQGPALNTMVALNPQALAGAEALDNERRTGRVRGPLHGIPVVVKDNYETMEMPTTAGSIALSGFHPHIDAFQVRRLKEAGAVIIGKTNMHELASGITTISSSGGQTKNPYDLDRNPGGSSGGTGAAIAANFAMAGMGSDTCGSIRIPAGNNNLVGLRGTRGLSSRTGIVPLSSTQDIGGPLARTITDLAIVLDATVGSDPADESTRLGEGRIPKSFRDALAADALKGKRIGVLRSLFGTAPEDQEVTAVLNKTLDRMKQSGAEVVDVSVPGLDDLLRDSSLINAEFKFDLADYLARHEDAPVKSLSEILDRGLYHAALEAGFRLRNMPEKRDSEEYRRAMIKRTAIRQAVLAVFEEDRLAAVVYPTLRRKAARIGDAQAGSNCQLSAHSGLPALGIPAGFTDDGVPVGMDVMGRDFSDAELLSIGFSIEQTLKLRRTPFSTPALENGKAPAPRHFMTSIGEFTYDMQTGTLTFKQNAERLSAERVTAIWIHRGEEQKPGPAVYRLFPGTGMLYPVAVTLTHADRQGLAEGKLLLRVFSANQTVAQNIKLALPSR
jgi:Asp-tRNA(Asn)/Glu-tRNA(Gln) amidotransferase A subunit family amidase